MMTPEGQVKADINDYLDSLGEDRCYHFAYHNMGYGRAGIPDRLVCYRGKFIALEVKAGKNEATVWQERRIREIKAAGGLAFVVRSVAEVQGIIAALDL